MIATRDASWAISAATPTAARPRTRRATPSGKRRAGRSRSRSRSAGPSAVRTSAATPAVVPIDSTSSAGRVSAVRRVWAPSRRGANAPEAAITTRVEITGAGPGAGHRQYRHHRAGERAAEDDVVDDVRHLVGGRIGGAQAVVADGVREHQLAAEPHQAGEHRDPPDEDGSPPDADAHLPQRPRFGHLGRGPGHGEKAP